MHGFEQTTRQSEHYIQISKTCRPPPSQMLIKRGQSRYYSSFIAMGAPAAAGCFLLTTRSPKIFGKNSEWSKKAVFGPFINI